MTQLHAISWLLLVGLATSHAFLACAPGYTQTVSGCTPIAGACCLPATCDPGKCGSAPLAPAYQCDDGSTGGNTGVCQYNTASGQCEWLFRNCLQLELCKPAKCGPQLGLMTQECDDGSVGGNTGICRKLPNGSCGWLIRSCPTAGCVEQVSRSTCACYKGKFQSGKTCAEACPAPNTCGNAVCLSWQVCDRSDASLGPFCKDTCDGFPCGAGEFCKLQVVNCIRAPCPPIATCLPNKCLTVKCSAGFECWPATGTCVNFSKCAAITCLAGSQCNPITNKCEPN